MSPNSANSLNSKLLEAGATSEGIQHHAGPVLRAFSEHQSWPSSRTVDNQAIWSDPGHLFSSEAKTELLLGQKRPTNPPTEDPLLQGSSTGLDRQRRILDAIQEKAFFLLSHITANSVVLFSYEALTKTAMTKDIPTQPFQNPALSLLLNERLKGLNCVK